MEDGDRAARFSLDKLYGPQEARNIGKRNNLGQEPAHLDLRVLARLEAAKNLHDEIVADERTRVGLFGADGAHVRDCRHSALRKLAHRPELEPQHFADVLRSADLLNDESNELGIGGDSEQCSFAWAMAHGGKCIRVAMLAVEAS